MRIEQATFAHCVQYITLNRDIGTAKLNMSASKQGRTDGSKNPLRKYVFLAFDFRESFGSQQNSILSRMEMKPYPVHCCHNMPRWPSPIECQE